MAALPSIPLVSVEEYLNSSYSPDREYVDGVLIERSMPNIAHALLQDIVSGSIWPHRDSLRLKTLHNPRTQIVDRARYRVPDVVLCRMPLPKGRVIDDAPWAVIEILSPTDKMSELLRRFREFANVGTLHIVLLDPELLVAYRYQEGSLIKTRFTHLDLPTGSLPFDTEAMFRELLESRSDPS